MAQMFSSDVLNDLLDNKQSLIKLDWLSVFDQHFTDHTFAVGLNLVHEFHSLNNAKGLTLAHPGTDLNKWIRPWS